MEIYKILSIYANQNNQYQLSKYGEKDEKREKKAESTFVMKLPNVEANYKRGEKLGFEIKIVSFEFRNNPILFTCYNCLRIYTKTLAIRIF